MLEFCVVIQFAQICLRRVHHSERETVGNSPCPLPAAAHTSDIARTPVFARNAVSLVQMHFRHNRWKRAGSLCQPCAPGPGLSRLSILWECFVGLS